MANFPVVESRLTGAAGENKKQHPITMDATINSGDLLIVLFVATNDTDVSIGTSSGDWVLAREVFIMDEHTSAIVWKFATGSGENLTLNTDISGRSAHISLRVSGAGDLFVSSDAQGVNSNADPPGVTRSQIQARLWIATAFFNNSAGATAPPTNYNNFTEATDGTAAISVASGERLLLDDGEDPGTFTNFTGGSSVWIAYTIAVDPGFKGKNSMFFGVNF